MGIGPREWVLLGANFRHTTLTNGDFTAYVCNSAATRPSSQISLGKFVSHDMKMQEVAVVYPKFKPDWLKNPVQKSLTVEQLKILLENKIKLWSNKQQQG